MSSEDAIKKFSIEAGATIVGIAAVDDINKYAPKGYRPDDILPGAKSVIVPADRLSPRGAWRSPWQSTEGMNRSFAEPPRNVLAMKLADFIEEKYGYYSMMYTGVDFSQALCAAMAGLGTYAMCGAIILNKNIGVINFATVITTMPLEADGPLIEPVCPHTSCVKRWEREKKLPCLEACPECLSGELENGKIKWMKYNGQLCATRANSTGMQNFVKFLAEAINEPNLEVRTNIINSHPFALSVGFLTTGFIPSHCGECFRGCPIDIHARTLHPKN